MVTKLTTNRRAHRTGWRSCNDLYLYIRRAGLESMAENQLSPGFSWLL